MCNDVPSVNSELVVQYVNETEDGQLGESKYAIQNVVCRSGSNTKSGHFYNYVYDNLFGWFRIDTENVSKVETSDDLKSMFDDFGLKGTVFLYTDNTKIQDRPFGWNLRLDVAKSKKMNDLVKNFEVSLSRRGKRVRKQTDFFNIDHVSKKQKRLTQEFGYQGNNDTIATPTSREIYPQPSSKKPSSLNMRKRN